MNNSRDSMTAKRLRLDDQLCFALYAATNAVTRAYRPLLADLNLTYPQYLVMLVLWQDGPLPIRALGTRLHLGANAITPLVDHLAQAGFVVRQRDSADRRSVRVELTEKGRALEGAAALAQDVVACRVGMETADHQRLRATLMELVERVASGAPPAPAPERQPEPAEGDVPATSDAEG